MSGSIIDILFPQRCPICGQIRPYGKVGMCEKCEIDVPWINEPVCLKCGKMIEDDEDEYCDDCRRIPKNFERCFAAFAYENKVKDSIYEFKYKNQRNYAGVYADCIMRRHGKNLLSLKIDGIVPIPIHSNKKRKRGYNQAELLADKLAERLGVPVYPDYLVRCNDTAPQKELNDAERIKNLKNAFKIGENDVKLNTVLLVDDIYTSGATMVSCTEVLKAHGTGKVYCSVIAIGRGYS